MKCYVSLSKLSSKYYSLIPVAESKDELIKPINNQHTLQQEYTKMDNLVNVEFTSRLLLAALYRQYTMNPIQYIYNSMGAKITPLEEGDPECDMVRAYCLNTGKDCDIKGLRIFKVERRGEVEPFEKIAEAIGNRKLLFHGSSMTNFLGILAQGMRIAPPEAPTTGFMFGKGCYFADMFAKSF